MPTFIEATQVIIRRTVDRRLRLDFNPPAVSRLRIYPADLYEPGALPIENFVGAVNADAIDLSWTAREAQFTDYRIYRSTDGITYSLLTTIVDTALEAYSDTGLTEATYYYYIVGVLPSGIESETSIIVSEFVNISPENPTNLAVIAQNEQAVFSWDASVDPNFSEYIIYLDAVEVARTTSLSYLYTGLTNGVAYDFGVQAIDDEGATSALVSITDTVADTIAPAAPTLINLVASDNKITVNWDPNAEPDLSLYRVYITDLVNHVDTTVGLTYDFTGLTNGVSYTIGVSAVDTSGNVSAVTTASSTPVDLVNPDPPTSLVIGAVAETSITISATASVSPDVSYYDAYYDQGGGYIKHNGSTISEAALVAGYEFSGLTTGISTDFYFIAVDDDGNSSAPSSVATETPASAITPITTSLDFNTGEWMIRSTPFSGITNFTLEAWVKFDAVVGLAAIVGQDYLGAGQGFGLFYNNGTGKLSCQVRDDSGVGSSTITGTITPIAGTWYHLAMTYDQTTGVQILYVDGVFDATATLAGVIFGNTIDFAAATRTTVGGIPATVPFAFNGKMSQVRVWDRVRTAGEILANKDVVLSGSETNLIGYYRFDDLGATAVDSSVTGVDGTITGANSIADVPF